MNYQRIYNRIIENRKKHPAKGYTEIHHIVPRSLGGSDDINNTVALTAREHFVCHYLLAKIYEIETPEWYKMNHAFLMMKAASYVQDRYFNSRLYSALRKNMQKAMSNAQGGKNNSQFGTRWIHNKTLKENKKISKILDVPPGWEPGRVISWSKKIVCCKHCKQQFEQNTKEVFCSSICKKEYTNPFVGKEKEFLTYYEECNKSMNKALKKMGYPGAVSHYYKWARSVLDNQNI